MPDAGYFGLTYELLFEGDSAWTDVTPLVDSRATKVDIAGCSEDLKSVISKCSFELRYGTDTAKTTHSALVGEILTAKQAGQTVQFRMGGIATFVGKVDLGSFSQKNGRIPGFVTVTVEDNSYLLDEKMDTSFEYPANDDLDDTGWAVFDKSNLAQSVVMLRLLDAGYTVDQIDTTASDSITEKVRRIVYDADDERTYREMLDTLLFEYCAVIYTTPEGKLSVRRLYKESPVSERSVDDFLVNDGIQTGGGDYAYDGVKVVWSNLSRLDGAVVYNANITMKLDDEGNREGEEIQPQHYWPEDGDIEETWQEFNATFLDRDYQTKVSRLKNKDLSLISVKNAYYEVDKDAEILLANNPPEIEPTKARVLWWNSHESLVKKLYGFTIVGDALFRSKLNESTYPIDAKRLDEPYETEFVYTSEVATRFANHLHRFRKYGDLQHKWTEIGVATPMFQVVTVSAPDTLISSLGMVISQSITFPAPNKVKRANSAIGITAFNSEPVRTRSIQLGGAPVNTGPAGENGTRSVVQFILGTADGPYSDAGNVLGTDLALVGTSIALVGVDGAQWSASAPTPDAGEFVWRREGYYTPPETWPSVWNVTRMTGASSFGLTLHPSALTIPVTSRGVPYGGDITISAVFQNIPTSYVVTWGIVGASFVDEGTNVSKVVDVTTLTADAVLVTASVLFGGTTYNAPYVTLTKVADGKPAPVYIGKSHSIPLDVGGEPVIKGDFFIVDEEFTVGATTYKAGEVWEYSGTAWVLSDSAMKAIDAMDDFVSIKLASPTAVEEGIFCEVVAKKIMAQEAVITEIGTKEITIKEDGSIASSYDDNGVMKRYERGTIDKPDLPEDFGGFYLGADGHMELVRVRARDGVYSGVLESTDAEGTLLHTQKYELGRQLPVSPKTHYLASDISAIFPDKASKEVSINAGSYVHAFALRKVKGGTSAGFDVITLDNSRTVALPQIKSSSKVVLYNSTPYISKVEYSKNFGAFTEMSGSVGVSVSQGDGIMIRQTYNNPNAFVALGQTSRQWFGMTTLGNDVYACVNTGDIYKQTNGTGNFVSLGQTSRWWTAMTTLGNDVYACVYNGDIYKQTNGTGNFVAIGQARRDWYGMTTLGNDVYACVWDGDIYKQTNGTGNFVALGQELRQWAAMTALGNDVYACVSSGDIYKQTNGTGNFVALGQTPRYWDGMTTLGNDVYACEAGGDIYKQTNGTGNFVALGQTSRNWYGMTTLGNDVYACVFNKDIYKQAYNPTHQSTISIALPNTEALVLARTNASTANGTYDDFNGEVITFDTVTSQSEKSVVIKSGGTTVFDSALNLYRTFKTVYDDLESVGTYSLDELQSTFNGTKAGYVVKSQNQLTFLTLSKAVIATIGSTTYTKTNAILYLLGQSRGVKTATLLPETGASVGTAQNPYSAGFFEQVIAETFDNSSARDKKKDITPFLGSALDILKQVQVVNYRYKTEIGEYLHTGFIADDTPDPLTGADHNSMSLGDNIGMLIKAVQELYALHESLIEHLGVEVET